MHKPYNQKILYAYLVLKNSYLVAHYLVLKYDTLFFTRNKFQYEVNYYDPLVTCLILTDI